MRPDLILVDRLWKLYLEHWPIPRYLRLLTPESILTYKVQAVYVSDDARTLKQPTHAWDCGRVRYFYERVKAGKKLDPIMVDNVCMNGRIYVEPVIVDGHHRLVAAHLAGEETIPADYSGRVDLLNYLTGKRKTCPVN